MKKIFCVILSFFIILTSASAAPIPPEIVSQNVVLMERDTGTVLYQNNPHTPLAPASVTKVMTLLIVMEAIDSGRIKLTDIVSVSEYAAGMGGSQVFLEPGEQMSVNDMLKATFISSGNDSAVALAEHISGSESSFVDLMNKRAKELGMNDTTFKNCTGLDAEGHVTSAYDIALMSRELIKHKQIRTYTTTWIDSLRNGEFQLANTNKLVRTYNGITGLKTGYTSVAKFCLSATAERNGMELIASIMASPSSKERFSDATKMLDYGFANFAIYNEISNLSLPEMPVTLGELEKIKLNFGTIPSILVEKSTTSGIKHIIDLPDSVKAPVEKGQRIGCIRIMADEQPLSEIPIIAGESIKKLNTGTIFKKMLSKIFMQ